MVLQSLANLLKEPTTRYIDLDDPGSYALIRETIRKKPFLRKIYAEWYGVIAAELERAPPGSVLEIGSGAGFCKEFVPDLITSEVQHLPWVHVVLDGRCLPFEQNSLSAVVMVDVLHHIPDVAAFFHECDRCLVPGGRVVMIEPWITAWSKFVYTHFHHEPVDMEAREWSLPPGGPMSMANSALPWILFERDRLVFEANYRRLNVETIELFMPASYLLSGGISYRTIVPGRLYRPWRSFEALVTYLSGNYLSMFARICIAKSG